MMVARPSVERTDPYTGTKPLPSQHPGRCHRMDRWYRRERSLRIRGLQCRCRLDRACIVREHNSEAGLLQRYFHRAHPGKEPRDLQS